MNNIVEMKKRTRRPADGETAGLYAFFHPRSVAVIGASPKPGNLGGRIVESLRAHGFRGTITTVHPKGLAFTAVPAVRSVDELPEGTDLAILAVPASSVPGLIEPLAKQGIRHLIVVGGGFAETAGGKGLELQESVARLAAQHGMRVVGPNGLGVFSAPARFNSFFLTPGEIALPPPGPAAIVSQSGAFLSLLLDRFAGLGIGVQYAVNFGNRLDVDESELLETFARDPAVKVIGLYLESFKDGRRFVETARRVSAAKAVVVWKGGQGGRGNDAARAHSASLAGSYEVFQAACAKAGVIEVCGFEEFSNALAALSRQVPARGDRTLIVSNGGGMGVLLADLCRKAGLEIPPTPEPVLRETRKHFPEYFSLANPVDLTGSGTNEQCIHSVESLLSGEGGFDCLLMVLLSGTEGITADIAPLLKNRLPKTIPVVIGAYGEKLLARLRETFAQSRVSVLPSAELAVQALQTLVRRHRLLSGLAAAQRHAPYEGPTYSSAEVVWPEWTEQGLDEMELKFLLGRHGVETPLSIRVENEMVLNGAMKRLGFPLVLKAAGAEIKHKSELRAIRVGLEDPSHVHHAWRELSERWPGKIWAEQQLPPGLDLMVGAHRDPQFGTVLVFGTGGKYVEIHPDCARALSPAGDAEIRRMIDSTAAGRIIGGVRGDPPLDIKNLVAFIRLVEEWMEKNPDIESLDFNPVRLYQDNLVVLDAKVGMRPRPQRRDAP